MASNLTRVTVTGAVVSRSGYLKSVALEGGSAASTVVLNDSTDGTGTDILSLAAAIGESASWTSGDTRGAFFGTGIHATLAGAGAAVSVEFE